MPGQIVQDMLCMNEYPSGFQPRYVEEEAGQVLNYAATMTTLSHGAGDANTKTKKYLSLPLVSKLVEQNICLGKVSSCLKRCLISVQ